MPSKWIGSVHKGPVCMRWSLRQKNHRFDPEDRSSNAGERECSMQSHSRFSTELTKGDRLSLVQRMNLPILSTWASQLAENIY